MFDPEFSIGFYEPQIDTSVLARTIYRDKPNHTTDVGVRIGSDIVECLRLFLRGFNKSVEVQSIPYYRIDAYFDSCQLHILEVNAAFVDGWGTALNLSRASGIGIDPHKLHFPRRLASPNPDYYPEIQLFQAELAHLGLNHEVVPWDIAGIGEDPIYVYGRLGTEERPQVFPYDGVRLDNKHNLADFRSKWHILYSFRKASIPEHYRAPTPWEDIPEDVVFKFCDKGSVECQRSGQSVLFGKPSGKAPFLKRCYREGKLIAQELVHPATREGHACQLVILTMGNEPVTGYAQFKFATQQDLQRGIIVNDDSLHGPLLLL